MTTPEALWVYVTTSSEAEALRIARALVQERLAACANVLPGMRSVYRWQGELCEDAETALICKTTPARLDALTARICALHAADCPCVLALPVVGGNAAFLEWIIAESEA